jgi:hypothetical protein
MSTPQLADLLTVPTQDAVLNQEVLPELQKRKVRTTDWITGSVQRAQAYVIALMRVSTRLAIAALCAAGFEDYVFGVATPPPNPDGSVIDVTGWAPFLAQQRHGVTQIPASYTRRNITFTNAIAVPYGPLQPGSVIVQFPSGNRYVLDQVVTIGASTTTIATFRSEFTSNSLVGRVYNDAPGSSPLVMVTSNFPGVTVTNPAPTYTPVSEVGSGVGLVTPSGSPATTHSVALRIDATGSVAGATVGWSTNVDNLGWVVQSGSSANTLGGVAGLNVSISDNGGAPAFEAGTVYYWATPGSDVTQIGADVETPQALGIRCRGLIPSLAFAKDGNGNWIPASPTQSAYAALALSANSQVRVVLAANDGTVNNKVNLIIAGQGGVVLPPAVVANVTSFFNAYSMLTDVLNVQGSTARTITLGGLTITALQSKLASAQSALLARLQNYLGGVDPVVPLGINGTVDYDYIIALVRTTPGVVKVSGTLTINSAATDLSLPVTPGAFESALWTQPITSAFSWTTA